VELSPPSEQKPAAVQDKPSAREHFRSLPDNQRLVIGGASAVLVVGSFVRFGFSGQALVGAILGPTLVLLAAIDLDRRLIPDVIVLPALAAVLILQIAFYPEHTLEWVIAMFGAALFLFLPMLISSEAMGMGDVKLAALLGAALGKSVVAALFVGLLAGGAYGLVVFAREGLAARRKAIAFGPFLALGGLVVLFLGGH
jgi:prepilin signal peptidase PulO-like enzyme (type II secretory pathway)